MLYKIKNMFFWRKLFPYLQKYIPRYRNNKILRILDKFATTYHSLYENLNYDCKNNGEFFLLNQLNISNNLDCIFDVGANNGSYSLLARKINKKCLIFAFEPVPKTFIDLKKNVSNNSLINSFKLINKISINRKKYDKSKKITKSKFSKR